MEKTAPAQSRVAHALKMHAIDKREMLLWSLSNLVTFVRSRNRQILLYISHYLWPAWAGTGGKQGGKERKIKVLKTGTEAHRCSRCGLAIYIFSLQLLPHGVPPSRWQLYEAWRQEVSQRDVKNSAPRRRCSLGWFLLVVIFSTPKCSSPPLFVGLFNDSNRLRKIVDAQNKGVTKWLHFKTRQVWNFGCAL